MKSQRNAAISKTKKFLERLCIHLLHSVGDKLMLMIFLKKYSLTILHPKAYIDFSYPHATKCTPHGKHRDKVYHGKKKRLCVSKKTQ